MAYWNEYTQPNLGLLFYKQIYKETAVLNYLETNNKNELVINVPKEAKTTPFDAFYKNIYATRGNTLSYIKQPLNNLNNFELFTTYPGVLCGTGYGHDTKAKGDFKIGFFFDHTTGQPILPGSSVKGILRSLFECDLDAKGNEKTGEKSVAVLKFIFLEAIEICKDESLKTELTEIKEHLSEAVISKTKKAIFGGQDQIGADIFFDAVINFEKLGNERFLSNDFITPHQHDLLKNPVPLMFLKVLPNVPFQFRFKLSNDGWTTDVKEAIFKTILLTIGAGAKTNVGYGQFSETKIEHNYDTEIINGTNINEDKKDKLPGTGRTYIDHTPDSSIYKKENKKGYEIILNEIIEPESENCYYEFVNPNSILTKKDTFYKKEKYFVNKFTKKGKSEEEYMAERPKVGDVFILTVNNNSPFQYTLKRKK